MVKNTIERQQNAIGRRRNTIEKQNNLTGE
jgi:hypothetical protein